MLTFTDAICANYDILIFGMSSNIDMFYNREEKNNILRLQYSGECSKCNKTRA